MAPCATCKKPAKRETAGAAFPFCSPRCKLLDLDNWFAGRYVVASPLPWSDDGDTGGLEVDRAPQPEDGPED